MKSDETATQRGLQPMVCMLRGINVGGHKLVSMTALRQLFEEHGLGQAQTVLQSGNVVFRALPARSMKTAIEDAIERTMGLRPDAILRTRAEFRRAVDLNPFGDVARNDPARLLLVALDRKPASAAAAAIEDWDRGPERVRVVGDCCYVHYPEGVGRSKLTLPLLERSLQARATGRNWNTVLRILNALES